jgi:LPXTG-motif cell wall-anchored protein
MLPKLVTKSLFTTKLNSLGGLWWAWLGLLLGNKFCFRIVVDLFLAISCFLSITWASVVVITQTIDTSQITINLQGKPNAGVQPADDQATTTQGQTVRIDVSSNDIAINSFLDRTSIGVVNPPSNGTATVVGFFIDYTPNPGFVGQDTFTYRICNTQFDCGQAVVTLQVTGSSSNNNNNGNNNGGGGNNNNNNNNNNAGNNQNQNIPGNNNSGNNNSNNNSSNNPRPNNNPFPPGPLPITGGVTGLSVFLGFGLLVLLVVFLYRKRNDFRIIFTQQSNSSNSEIKDSDQAKIKGKSSQLE